MQVQRVIAFKAVAVQAALVAPFFLVFIHKVVIEGVRWDSHHIADILASSVYLSRHSAVVIMTRHGRDVSVPCSLEVTEYVWTHPRIRPWGSEIPLQCPACGALASLVCRTHAHGTVFTACRGEMCTYARE